MEIELDNDWIGNYEKKELEYHDFYKDDIKYIKIYSLFVNDNLALENIKEETIFFEEKNLLKKQQLLSIINKQKNKKGNIKLLTILKYNIDLEADNVGNYLKQSTDSTLFLEQLKTIDDISFKPSITMFEDLNSLFLIFIQSDVNKFNQTKRIILHSKQKKTKKRKV